MGFLSTNLGSHLNKIKNGFSTCTQFGINSKTPENSAHKIRLVNGFCVLAIILFVVFSIADFLRQSYIEVVWDVFAIFPFFIPLLLNKWGYVGYSRVAFIVVCNVLIVLTMWGLGSLEAFGNLLPISLALVCAIFDWSTEKIRMVSVYILTVVCFCAAMLFPKQGYFINLENVPAINYFVMGFCSIGMSWLILYFNNNVNQYIKATMAQFTAREQQIKAIAQVGKFAAIGQLAGGIAHEINNPVAIIRGKAEIIGEYQKKQGISDEFVRKHLDGIIQTTQRISQITHSMLSLSRADSGDKNRFDVKKAILETVSMCFDSMAKHGITIKSQLEALDSEVESQGSRGHFQQAVMNLLTNSRDALLETPPSEPAWIEIVAIRSSTGIGIEISDNGPGISVANAERIMDPFFTTKEVGKGTGLGLSLSKTLMEAQGGQLILVNLKNPTAFRLVLASPSVDKKAA